MAVQHGDSSGSPQGMSYFSKRCFLAPCNTRMLQLFRNIARIVKGIKQLKITAIK